MAEPPQPARRYKTTLSCAECRRLKLRCDRVFPCTSCQRRGCASICPDGHMPPSKSTRKDQPSQLEILRARVQELEHEVATLKKGKDSNSQSSDDGEASEPSHDGPSQSEDTEKLTERLGTLSISGYGKSRFFGVTGGAAQLLWNIEDNNDAENLGSTCHPELDAFLFPPEILFLITAFPSPIPSQASPEIWNWIIGSLPSHMEAWSLFETFYENAAYIYMSLPRKMFIEQIFSFFYGSDKASQVNIPRGHRLAMLLMVFAIAELLDLTKPATPTGGKRFYYLARAALTLERLYEHPTLTAVQAIFLMMLYLNLSDHKDSAELVWVLSGIVFKLALMLGLHRDSEKFNVKGSENDAPATQSVHSPAEAELRRVIFHEVVHFEIWQSLALGRPSMVNFEQYDCSPPGGGPERESVHERDHATGQAWSYGFLRECLIKVLDFTVNVKSPKYADIIKLDAKIREFKIPTHIQIGSYENESADSTDPPSRAITMLRFSAYSMKEVALLYLHRSCFAALMSDTSDPLSSPFAYSVRASHQSATTIVVKMVMLYDKEPLLSIRIYLFWAQLVVSCVLGAIVVRFPGCSLASNSLEILDVACDLFQKAKDGVRPAAVLPLVVHLRHKAHTAYDLYNSGHRGSDIRPEELDVSAEISALGGRSSSRSVSSQPSSTSPADTTVTQRSSPSAAPSPPQLGLPTDYIASLSDAATEVPMYSQNDWGVPLTDTVSSTSIPLDTFLQEAFQLPTGDSSTPAFPDFFSEEAHTSFLHPELLGNETQLEGFSPVDMAPTWQNFMAQMGFN